MKKLPFKANGHVFGVADGELVDVSLDLPGDPYVFGISSYCGVCDKYAEFEVTGDTVAVRTPCAYRGGFTGTVRLAVPSGKIIVADDLRPVYNWREYDGMASYNSAIGQKQAVDLMAKAGCAYGPVGNSCPGLYRTGPDTYVIASGAYDEETDREVLPAGWELLAGIITDLWAYSIADFEDWKARGGDPGTLGWSQSVVDVTPGTYRFTHHTWEPNFNGDAGGTVVFADIRKLED